MRSDGMVFPVETVDRNSLFVRGRSGAGDIARLC